MKQFSLKTLFAVILLAAWSLALWVERKELRRLRLELEHLCWEIRVVHRLTTPGQ